MNVERLIDLNSDFLGGHLFAGMAYLQLGKYKEALKKYEMAVSLKNGPYSISSLGVLYAIMGDTIKAREAI